MARNAPGKRFRKGMSRVEAVLLFLDDAAAEQRYAEVRPGRTGRGIRTAGQATSGTKPPAGACASAAAQAASNSRFPPGPRRLRLLMPIQCENHCLRALRDPVSVLARLHWRDFCGLVAAARPAPS